MPVYLVPVDGGDAIKLDKAILFFGRHADCDVVVSNSRKVSRKHCCVAQIGDGIVARDIGSMNGVRVNDEVSRDELPMTPGDVLWVGDVGFRMEVREEIEKPCRPDTETASPIRSATLDRKLDGNAPVPIAEEGRDFAVEQTIPPGKKRRPRPDSEVIELSESDIIDDDTSLQK